MQIVLIGGAQRSGTTLLQTLLANALEDAPLLPEAHLLMDLATAYKRAANNWDKTSGFFDSKTALQDFFQAAIERYFDALKARCRRASTLVLKEPNFALVEPELRELLPGAVMIVSIRDPRDIVASFLKIGERQIKQGVTTHYARRNIDFICKKIARSYENIRSGTDTGIHRVRYEDLVRNPIGELRKVASETGLALDDARLEAMGRPQWLEPHRRHNDATWVTELEGQPASPDSVGSYKTILRPDELARVEHLCGELIRELGYETPPAVSG